MKNKKILLVMLLGVVAFFTIDIYSINAVTINAKGAPDEAGSGQESCEGHTSCWDGTSGTTVKITPVPGTNLKGCTFELDGKTMEAMNWAAPTTGRVIDPVDPEHAEYWKESIAGLGAVVNGEAEPNKLQLYFLQELADKNNMSVEEFKKAYFEEAKRNEAVFEYKDTPKAYVCKTGTDECGWFTDVVTCMTTLGVDNFGCTAADWATKACGKEECTGDDEDMMRQEESCIEKYTKQGSENPAYDCCVENYGQEKCDSGPSGSNDPIEPGTCNPPETEPITYPSLVLIPQESEGSVGCGNTYTTYSYDYGTTSCEYVNTLITTVRTEKYPGISGTYEAGERFNFSNVVYWYSNRTEKVWDYSPLKNELSVAESIKNSLENQKSCLENKKAEYQQLIKNLACEPGYTDVLCSKECEKKANAEEIVKCVGRCYVQEDCTKKETLEKKYNGEIQNLDNQIKSLEPQIAQEQARIDELNACGSRANSFRNTSSSSSGSYTLNSTYLKLDKYTQSINSVKGIAKNSGQLLTQNELTGFEFPYFTNNSNFVIPIGTKNGTTGSVVTNLYSCPINVRNMLIVECSKGNCGTGGINVIYRPISLTNPFPNIKSGGYRAMGANWNETYAEIVIKNNRDVSDYDVYKKTPIYTIKLDATKIKEIRKYNKTTSFNNFDMQCTDGYLCKSNFLWGTTENGYDFSDIIVQTESCATASGWNACYGGAD